MTSKLKLSEQFRLRFENLRRATNDSPQTLLTFFREKPDFERLAREVKVVADMIEKAADYRKAYAQVAPAFISDFKDFSYKWRAQVAYVERWPLLSLNLFNEDGFEPPSFEEFKKTIYRPAGEKSGPDAFSEDDFDPSAHDGAAAIHGMLSLVSDQGQFRRDNPADDMSDYIANTYLVGVEAFEYFEQTIGIDVGTAFRRWNKLPAVFVPKHVSDRHGLTEKGSLYALLDEAVRAYVAGAPAAAIAMCRAILEGVLRDHYLRGEVADKDSLHDVIEIAAARYRFLDKRKLHDLRKRANGILHDYGGSPALDAQDEKAILQVFKDLKFYIEKAPAQ